ncbi:hypothetical protein AAIB48_12850 [Paraclostridium benzoelyticum]|jgi:hypothetical protein|uniref:hypothetical protein n=1 Tax=Paraclostridium benzoelyticum TaxID=1629550 RepID=UPI0031CD7926
MFKVEKIKEKINLEDLEVNSEADCIYDWHRNKQLCQTNCCCDCKRVKGQCSPYKISEY